MFPWALRDVGHHRPSQRGGSTHYLAALAHDRHFRPSLALRSTTTITIRKVTIATEQELGAVVERFDIDNRRRRRIFIVAASVGAVIGCLGVVMLLVLGGLPDASGALVFPSLVGGVGFGVFAVGIWQGRLSYARSDEVFMLHEGGLVHAYAGRSWAISWDEITGLTDQGRDNALHRVLGGDVGYTLKLRSAVGGRRFVVINGLTEDAFRLGEIVVITGDLDRDVEIPQKQETCNANRVLVTSRRSAATSDRGRPRRDAAGRCRPPDRYPCRTRRAGRQAPRTTREQPVVRLTWRSVRRAGGYMARLPQLGRSGTPIRDVVR